ncbi:MAG: cytochrome c3 family protein [Ignavibacteriae bacterium]|nr:cytochrome c3 family protein [Ignavibacteriota bacterium]
MLRNILALFVLVTMAATVSLAQTIVGSKHDLSTGGGITNKSTNETQVCIFCHTPHQTTVTATPLWNKVLSSQASYGVYASSSMNATPADIGGGTGTSNLCMSCHDGTVAVNNLGNKSTFGVPTMGSGVELDATGKIAAGRDANLGTSLTNDHPINFDYDATLATNDGGLVTPVSTAWVDAAHTIPLYGAKVQCASCHDAHKSTHGSFMRKSNAASALCVTCHTK